MISKVSFTVSRTLGAHQLVSRGNLAGRPRPISAVQWGGPCSSPDGWVAGCRPSGLPGKERARPATRIKAAGCRECTTHLWRF